MSPLRVVLTVLVFLPWASSRQRIFFCGSEYRAYQAQAVVVLASAPSSSVLYVSEAKLLATWRGGVTQKPKNSNSFLAHNNSLIQAT